VTCRDLLLEVNIAGRLVDGFIKIICRTMYKVAYCKTPGISGHHQPFSSSAGIKYG